MFVLYIGNEIDRIQSGGDAVNKRNIDFLRTITKNRVDIIEGEKGGFFLIRMNGYTKEVESLVLEKLATKKYSHVFISQSLLGILVRRIKKNFPEVRLICCFHNVELHYAREMLRVGGIRHLLFYFKARYNERLAAKYSDATLFLNRRDAMQFEQIYRRRPDSILPVAYDDRFEVQKVVRQPAVGRDVSYLFIGSAFFANIEAIRWFIREVMPHVPGHLTIVGKGMEQYDPEFRSGRVSVFGYIDNLGEVYYPANFVIMPIFSGSGMKTKTAEALMYGKTLIGTKEAFEGYVIDPNCMHLCQTAEQYIQTIKSLVQGNQVQPYNPHARSLFLEQYSYSSAIKVFSKLFQ